MHQDKQVVALILPFGAIKPLQKKRVQQNDVIKRAPVKAQTTGTKGEKRDGNNVFYLFHVLIWWKVKVSSSLHPDHIILHVHHDLFTVYFCCTLSCFVLIDFFTIQGFEK